MAGPELPPFPESFRFGVATSDHQCEAYEASREDVWDVWERTQNKTPRGRATDFWNRFREDIANAKALGCRMFRMSIAWSRVEPHAGVFDDEAFAHYRAVLEAIREAQMEPVVTLHHFTWPVHVQERGGLTARDFPETFERYAREVAKRLGSLATWWITFNEPTQLCYGFVKPWWETRYFLPPGLPDGASSADQMRAVHALMRNLFLAHARARAELRRVNPEARVGSNPMLLGLPGWLQRLIDWNAQRLSTVEGFLRHGRRFTRRRVVSWGRVDLAIANLTVTTERERKVAFSEPYFRTRQRLLVHRDGPIASARDLKGRAIAVVEGSVAAGDAEELFPDAQLAVVRDHAAAIGALDSMQVQAVFDEEALLTGIAREHPDRHALLDESFAPAEYAVAIAQGNVELSSKVNEAVREFLRSGAAERGCKAHSLPCDLPAPLENPLAQDAELIAETAVLRRIRRRGYLKIAVKEHAPGFSAVGDDGERRGLEIDLARAIARHILGDASRVRFYPATSQERLPLVRSVLRFLEPLFILYATLSSMMTSNWWHLGMAGKLPPFLCPPECIGQQDFAGLDYYWGIPALRLDRVRRLTDAIAGRFASAPVWPGVLFTMLRYHQELFPRLPILIVENGCVDAADGYSRAEYLRRHIEEVQRAVAEGIPVEGYICWSITSNREWGLPFDENSDFGLFHVALDSDATLARQRTPAADAYAEIIARRSAV